MSDVPFKNPGWAGNTGEFDLTEEQVRGDDFTADRPTAGSHPAGSVAYPYMLEDKHPEAPLFEGDYQERFEKILTRYPNKQAALLPALGLQNSFQAVTDPRSPFLSFYVATMSARRIG